MATVRSSKFAFVQTDGQKVEQGLGRMRNVGFAGVQDAHEIIYVPGDIGRHAGLCIADNKHINLHRLQRVYRVENALAFLSGGCVDIQVQNIRTEASGGQIE